MVERKRMTEGTEKFFDVGYKIWLERNGAVLGDGLLKLLSNVHSAGSISRAASEMGMSYRAAWGKIKAAEANLGVSLVVTRVGGEAGGGSKLTPEAEELLKRFRRLKQEVERFMLNINTKVFEGWPGP
ncbi:MAG TPA: LysR family transcriptional regulator [Bacillota bacterium]|nr:LysR family transcriptional regulator [Bacillota bacterium]